MSFNLKRFAGKVAVVTGASAGIGAAIVKDLVKHGLIVAGLARRVERIGELAEELKDEPGKLYGFRCDLTIEDDIIRAIKRIINKLGDIHVLVNNAGVSLYTDLIGGETAKWKIMMDTNVMAVCIATREVIEDMKEKGTRGHIIHINSIAGHQIVDMPGLSVYGATKFALRGLATTLTNELARAKLPIKVTNVSPGYVKTEFLAVAGLPEEMPIPPLYGEDISGAVLYALSTPPHVNVSEITVTSLIE